MSLFNIKLKTKNGNDIKKKETFTVFFRINYKKNALTKHITAEYTYRIIYSKGIDDPGKVLELKNAHLVSSIEDLTLKVILNFCHIIGQITQKDDIDPDFVLFMSPDLEGKKNNAWQFLKDVFYQKQIPKVGVKDVDPSQWLNNQDRNYVQQWNEASCNRMKVNKGELDLLKAFGELNPNTTFMSIDPNKDKVKYAKSIAICNKLQDRIDRAFQISEGIDPY